MTTPRDPELEIARLKAAISDALAAMDGGLYGDARRILKTGSAKAVIASTGVKTGGAA